MMSFHPSRENLESFQNDWIVLKGKLAIAFSEENQKKSDLMREAIGLYHSFISTFTRDVATSDDEGMDIRPLNAKERLRFIEEKMSGRFAFIQLDALFSEAMKKAASQLARIHR
ncbi:hypothetical protein QWT69_08200 [Sporosarcina oncorhynchi]|uniref:YpoC-like domain-containing protein n=1 Tax=Sporosarcina oncorhynchi TaxID=3056444 RepID=A0ABZ0L9W3_9BACL|nr:hypothetical protein [Sporosarcina sp. T2O-4]WOV89072.1 hypothetical protein QWT69_08200 [Sporosarcina sp. T2O-4]